MSHSQNHGGSDDSNEALFSAHTISSLKVGIIMLVFSQSVSLQSFESFESRKCSDMRMVWLESAPHSIKENRSPQNSPPSCCRDTTNYFSFTFCLRTASTDPSRPEKSQTVSRQWLLKSKKDRLLAIYLKTQTLTKHSFCWVCPFSKKTNSGKRPEGAPNQKDHLLGQVEIGISKLNHWICGHCHPSSGLALQDWSSWSKLPMWWIRGSAFSLLSHATKAPTAFARPCIKWVVCKEKGEPSIIHLGIIISFRKNQKLWRQHANLKH